jgi:hypothetical protein
MMKQMNSVAHSCTSLFASLDILAYPTSASSLAMILAMHAIGNWCGGGWTRGTINRRRQARRAGAGAAATNLLCFLGQTEGIPLQLLLALGLFNAVRVRLRTRLLARVVGRAAGQYEALRLDGRHALPYEEARSELLVVFLPQACCAIRTTGCAIAKRRKNSTANKDFLQ